jgi:predicted DNA-binding transcriptional regulator AlpA
MHLEKEQFQLPLSVKKSPPPRKSALVRGERSRRSLPERVAGIDQVLSTRDIERITGRHRCTVYRWVCAGTFPGRRAGGGRGWLRSDVERWLNGGGSSQGF